MMDQGVCLVLGQDADTFDPGVDAVGEWKIDDSKFAAKGYGRLCTPSRQLSHATAFTTSQDNSQGFAQKKAVYTGVATAAIGGFSGWDRHASGRTVCQWVSVSMWASIIFSAVAQSSSSYPGSKLRFSAR